LRIPPAGELLEVNILPALVRWVGLCSFSEVVAIDICFEGNIFLVRMDRYHRSKNTLAELEIPIWVDGFCGKAGQGVDRGITVMRYSCDVQTRKGGYIECVSKGFRDGEDPNGLGGCNPGGEHTRKRE
jgi:hypothetical protein